MDLEETQQAARPEAHELSSVAEICERLRCNRITVWRMVRDRKFPKPIHIGSRTFWPTADVDAWLAEKMAARNAA